MTSGYYRTSSPVTALPMIMRSISDVPSNIVSRGEGGVIPLDQIDKEELVVRGSDLYLPASVSKYGHHFTSTNNTLIPMAGVDESNGDGRLQGAQRLRRPTGLVRPTLRGVPGGCGWRPGRRGSPANG